MAREKQWNTLESLCSILISFKGHTQTKSLEELSFIIIAAWARAMMSNANLDWDSHLLLCKEAFQTAAKLDNFIFIKVDSELMTRYGYLGGSPKFYKQLQMFVKAGTVKIGNKFKIWGHEAPLFFPGAHFVVTVCKTLRWTK